VIKLLCVVVFWLDPSRLIAMVVPNKVGRISSSSPILVCGVLVGILILVGIRVLLSYDRLMLRLPQSSEEDITSVSVI
jgi:hypothetical protein